jgi:hypothetical protein
MAVVPQILVPTAIKPVNCGDRPINRPKNLIVPSALTIEMTTKGRATSVNFPALKKLSRMPKSIIPIRKTVVAQNFKPSRIASFNVIVLAIIIPNTIAIMMSLMGDREKPSKCSPIHCAVKLATSATAEANIKPGIQVKLLEMGLDNIVLKSLIADVLFSHVLKSSSAVVFGLGV